MRNVCTVHQGGRSWQPFGEHQKSHKAFGECALFAIKKYTFLNFDGKTFFCKCSGQNYCLFKFLASKDLQQNIVKVVTKQRFN